MAEPTAVSSTVVRHGDAVVVAVRGEVDLGSADTLRELLRAPEAQAATVILDLREVTFIDSSGLSVILSNNKRAAGAFRFAVAVGGATIARRLFELSGLNDTVNLIDDPEGLLYGRS
jgi:anti-anti-sigma factor